jgi:hypothetical protein
MTGRYVDDIPEDEMRYYVQNLYTRAVERRSTLFEKDTRIFKHQVWQHEALLLPLSSDGANVDMLMIYRKFANPKPFDLDYSNVFPAYPSE